MEEFKSNAELIKFIEREGNKAINKAIQETYAKGLPNVFVIDGKLIYKMPNGRIRNTSPFNDKPKSKRTK